MVGAPDSWYILGPNPLLKGFNRGVNPGCFVNRNSYISGVSQKGDGNGNPMERIISRWICQPGEPNTTKEGFTPGVF